MKDLRVVRGTISAEWAKAVDPDQVWRDSYRYEHGSGADSRNLRAFRYESLAGLSALVTQRVFGAEAIGRFADRRHRSIVNLAGEAPARLTSTGLLVAACLERPESLLEESTMGEPLSSFSLLGKYLEDGDDTWVIPDAAITLVEDQVIDLQLPHQA